MSEPISITQIENTFSAFVFGLTFPKPTLVNEEKVKWTQVDATELCNEHFLGYCCSYWKNSTPQLGITLYIAVTYFDSIAGPPYITLLFVYGSDLYWYGWCSWTAKLSNQPMSVLFCSFNIQDSCIQFTKRNLLFYDTLYFITLTVPCSFLPIQYQAQASQCAINVKPIINRNKTAAPYSE